MARLSRALFASAIHELMLARCIFVWLLALALGLSACQGGGAAGQEAAAPEDAIANAAEAGELPAPTPYPTRPVYPPGELVAYTAQPGDTLEVLAIRFNTRVEEILRANAFIPGDATTMPPGMPMQIPIYYAPFWGNPFQILPNSYFVNGPAQQDFSTAEFVARYPGWLRYHSEYASGNTRSGAELVDLVALNYSVSPRLLLALLEYHSQALSAAQVSDELLRYPLGRAEPARRGLYLQLIWAANTLNNGYYGWQSGRLTLFELRNQRIERPDPWQTAATVALQHYYSILFDEPRYQQAIGPDGLAQTYTALFGDPWASDQPHIPGSLTQPAFLLPMERNKTWAYTGGPHTPWGDGEPLAAIDFAPAAEQGGCVDTPEWATAVAAGVVARSETGVVVLDLDGDGDERTGWVVFYLHLATEGRAPLGRQVQAGERLGHPSCEGGRATGTHVHIARKYNGEWIQAEGKLGFNMEGWQVKNGARPYLGFLVRDGKTLRACECADNASQIRAEEIQTP